MGTGVLTLLLTGTRSSEFAAIAGVLVLVLLTPHERILGLRKRFVGWSAAGLLLVTIGYWVARNPTLSGRVTAWDDFLALWWSEPVDGVGDRGVGLALEQGRITDQLTHAHSIWLDGLARDGLASLVAVVVVVVLALVVTARAARRARPVGLALVVSLLVGGLTETLFDWRYLGYQIAVLLCAVLISAAYTDEEAEGDRLPLLEPPGRVPSTP